MGAIVGGDSSDEACAGVGLDDVAVHDMSLDECGDDEVGEDRKRSKRQDEVGCCVVVHAYSLVVHVIAVSTASCLSSV